MEVVPRRKRKAGALAPALRRAAHWPPQWLRKHVEYKLGRPAVARQMAVPGGGIRSSCALRRFSRRRSSDLRRRCPPRDEVQGEPDSGFRP